MGSDANKPDVKTGENEDLQYEIGMVGLSFMGSILMLNMVDHDCAVAGYDKDRTKVERLRKESVKRNFRGAANILNFIRLLRKPSSVMMLVPADAPVDSVIKDLLGHFQLDDFSLSEVQLCLKQYNTSRKVGKKSYLEDSKINLEKLRKNYAK
ncbi:MAG: NAD(P)-binding domain-containing protein [Ignavibacteriaceae bacterium]